MDNKEWWKNTSSSKENGKALSRLFTNIKNFAIPVFVVVLIAIALLTSVYTVNDKQQAVVTTFGKVTSVTGPGMHFRYSECNTC